MYSNDRPHDGPSRIGDIAGIVSFAKQLSGRAGRDDESQVGQMSAQAGTEAAPSPVVDRTYSLNNSGPNELYDTRATSVRDQTFAQPAAKRPRTRSPSFTDAHSHHQQQYTDTAGVGAASTAKRASQACLRCRKQKLRCLGGWPCERCTKAQLACDFGQANLPPGPRPGEGQRNAAIAATAAAAAEANARLQQLESSVASLLAGLSGEISQGSRTGQIDLRGSNAGRLLHQAGIDPVSFGDRLAGASGAVASFLSVANSQARSEEAIPTAANTSLYHSHGERPILPPLPGWENGLPPPTHTRPVIPPRTSTHDLLPNEHQAPHGLTNQVRFASSPHQAYSAPSMSNTGSGISPSSAISGGTEKRTKAGKGQKAEERLAAATEEGFEPPFKSLLYQPAVWDNREQSTRSSPQPSGLLSRDESGGVSKEKEDPINTGLIDPQIAQVLFAFFVEHCHPFLPIVNIGLAEAFTSIRQSAFLISAILAIAARFYPRYLARSLVHSPPLAPGASYQLAEMAEAHLGRSLLRKQHALSDVQAILLLAAWGLQGGGRGPDAWVVTGHGARVARRLGVHQALAKASEVARRQSDGTEKGIAGLTDDATRLESFMPQWRTWLGWFTFDGLLSLGFGRPQSSQFETVDEQAFLRLRLSQTQSGSFPHPGSPAALAVYGDVYIAGQVQLAQVGRDIVSWSAMLTDPDKALAADPRRAAVVKDKEISVKSMLSDLNARLDEWSRLWIYNGSPYTLYLGSSARIARLHAEHMRLCLNSFALQAEPEKDEKARQYVKKGLMAAQSTIQTHFDSCQTDLALSFATDYLTITLAQAAVFLIRLARSPDQVRSVVSLDQSVVVHYLKMAIDTLEGADMSETRLSTFLGRTIRDIARAGGIKGLGLTPTPTGSAAASTDGRSEDQATGAEDISAAAFDIDSFLNLGNQFDLSYLLGLPGDDAGGPGMGMWAESNTTPGTTAHPWTVGNEFEYAMNGAGNAGLNWMGFDGDAQRE